MTTAIVVSVTHELKTLHFDDWRAQISKCLGEPNSEVAGKSVTWGMRPHRPIYVQLDALSPPTLTAHSSAGYDAQSYNLQGYFISAPDGNILKVAPLYRDNEVFDGYRISAIVVSQDSSGGYLSREPWGKPGNIWIGYDGKRFATEGGFRKVPRSGTIELDFRRDGVEYNVHLQLSPSE